MSRPSPRAALRRLRAAAPDSAAIAARLPHVNRKLLVRIWLLLVIGWIIYTGPMAYADDKIEVTGAGGLFFIPDLSGDGARMFWEKYIGISQYTIYTEANWNDPMLSALNVTANILMMVIVVLGGSMAATVGWLFSMTSLDGMAAAVGNVMGASAEGTMGWLFPTMLVLGGIVAWATRDKGGEGMLGNLLWIVVAGTALILVSLHPTQLVTAVDSTRTAGAEVVTTMAKGATVDDQTPIKYPTPDDEDLKGDAKDIAMRKNMDVMWRTMIVTPWCLAELGSIEACEQYGKDIVTQGGEDRSQAIDDAADAQSGSSTEKWLKGKDTTYAAGRVVVLLISLVVAAVFTIFMILAALTATFALVMAYLLLIVGPLFIAMGCVPGAPRQWVMAWGKQLIGQIIMSVIAFTLFSAILSMIAILFAATGAMGWLLSILVTFTAIIAAIMLRGRLEKIFNMDSGSGSGIGKYMLARKALSMMHVRGGNKARYKVPRPRTQAPTTDPADSGAGGGGGGPTPPALPPGRSGGPTPVLPRARERRALPASPTSRQSAPRREQRTATREDYTRNSEQTRARNQRTQGNLSADERSLPPGISHTRPHLTATPSARAEQQPASTRTGAGSTSSQAPTRRSASTAPSAQRTGGTERRVLSGEVVSPAPSSEAPAAPGGRRRRGAQHRSTDRVHFTRPDLPDAPRTRRSRRHAGETPRSQNRPRTREASAHGRSRRVRQAQ